MSDFCPEFDGKKPWVLVPVDPEMPLEWFDSLEETKTRMDEIGGVRDAAGVQLPKSSQEVESQGSQHAAVLICLMRRLLRLEEMR